MINDKKLQLILQKFASDIENYIQAEIQKRGTDKPVVSDSNNASIEDLEAILVDFQSESKGKDFEENIEELLTILDSFMIENRGSLPASDNSSDFVGNLTQPIGNRDRSKKIDAYLEELGSLYSNADFENKDKTDVITSVSPTQQKSGLENAMNLLKKYKEKFLS